MPSSDDPLLSLTAQIVSAQIERNEISGRSLPGLIKDVYRALAGAVGAGQPAPLSGPTRKLVSGQTVFDDHLVCQECGLSMKMLKRHLETVHHQTPAEYRAKFQLPGDYPMVARQYAALRSSLAKESGLGRWPVPRGR